MNYKIPILTLLSIVALFTTGKVALADNVNLSLAPSVTKVTAKPGSSPTFQYTLKNNGDPALVTVEALPFVPTDSEGHTRLDKNTKTPIQFSIKSDSAVLGAPILLKSNAEQDFTVTMQIDSSTPEKDYYFTVFVETSPFPATEGETTLQVATRVGSNILLSVSKDGSTEKKASIALLETVPQPFLFFKASLFDTFQKIPVILILNNDGRNEFTPQITLSVKGWNLQKKYIISPQAILSNSQRQFTDSLSGFFIGRYTVTASVDNGKGTQSVTTTTSFTCFPFIISGLILILLCAFFVLRKKNRTEKM